MRILIYDRLYERNGFSYPLRDAFESLGHQAVSFDWNDYLYTRNSQSLVNRIKNRVLFPRVARRINNSFIEQVHAQKFDFLLVIRGDHLFPETIIEAKQQIPVVANFSTDDFFNPLNSTRYMHAAFDKYDCIFSPRSHLKDEYINKGAQSFEVFNWYYCPGLLRPPDNAVPQNYRHEIAFVGSWSKRRERILSALMGLDVTIFGWGWSKKAARTFLSNVKCRPFISMREMMDVFAASKININIFTIENRDRTNPRNFDIPAAGGFQLSERSNEILQFFEEDRNIVCYEDNGSLKSKCDYFLKHDSERQEIAINGYQKVAQGGYSIVDTARQILSKIDS